MTTIYTVVHWTDFHKYNTCLILGSYATLEAAKIYLRSQVDKFIEMTKEDTDYDDAEFNALTVWTQSRTRFCFGDDQTDIFEIQENTLYN